MTERAWPDAGNRSHAAAASVDLTRVKPYGDTYGDGAVQLSFTLPVPLTEEAKEAARQLAGKMGLEEPQVVHSADLGEGFSFYILYGRCVHTVDVTRIRVPKVTSKRMTFDEINAFIRARIGRKVVVVGACTGDDAHTVGIDAIMNMKGTTANTASSATRKSTPTTSAARCPTKRSSPALWSSAPTPSSSPRW